MSPIQQYVIPELLRGRSVFGMARVGSGKTLAFVIPMIQRLIDLGWQTNDGLGALLLVPTRELGMQIFQVINQVAKTLPFTCGMVCGGHDYKHEAKLIKQTNVLVATPGRLIQHMNQGQGNIGDQLQYMIFDEIDEMLGQGFMGQLQEIINYFPRPYLTNNGQSSRVMGFFSATQNTKFTKLLNMMSSNTFKYEIIELKPDLLHCQEQDVKDLTFNTYVSDIHITDPLQQIIKISTYKDNESHEDNINPNLKTIVTTVSEADKIDVLFSIVRQFCDSKGLIFMATCKQVKFIYQAFVKLNCGVHLLHIHSDMSQNNRSKTFYEFKEAKRCFMITTDIVARGIDITDIQIVIQCDCPQDIKQFIHRAGRCTRFNKKGLNILFLSDQENCFKELLDKQNIKYETKLIKIRQQITIESALQALVASNNQLRQLAQKAVISYMRQIYTQRDKKVFIFDKYDMTKLARSYGLDVIVEKDDGTKKDQEKESDNEEFLVQKKIQEQQEPESEQETLIKSQLKEKTVTKTDIQNRLIQLQNNIDENDEFDRKEYKEIVRKMKHGESESEENINNIEENYEAEQEDSNVDWESG